MASRSPLGAKASPPTVEGTSSARSPFLVRADAILPTDHASAPSGPSARWSIHLPGAAATVSVVPSASVAATRPSSPAVKRRLPSLAASKIAPSCALTRRALSPVSHTLPSPTAKAALSPRKAAATTWLPASMAWTWETRESVFSCAMAPSRGAGFEALLQAGGVKRAADEDDAAVAPILRLPFALVAAVQHHMHALEHVAQRIVLEGEDALGAQNIGPLFGHQVLHPGEEFVRVERLFVRERH